ncbi:SRPBCC family protein [Actinomarinicola tropica]|uniref:Polyketide cyclase n=1 Tax=Actinomarinicola tropica TaxID=2789776 RepID=A0A5Q2RFA4_9ACTN|nr:SRPBCC family protein [Actinomarinicola tropica]QGG94314.1 polyketide cyclase [Actinomarinicola tropica]
MITETSIDIGAPAATVWRVFADVERWPTWTESVTAVEPLDGSDLAVGRRFALRQPGMPRLVWEIASLDPGRGWVWSQSSPGARTTAFHEVVALDDGRTRVRQGVDQRGPLGMLVGLAMRRTSRRFLRMEAEGLRARAEALHHGRDAAAS